MKSNRNHGSKKMTKKCIKNKILKRCRYAILFILKYGTLNVIGHTTMVCLQWFVIKSS